jgi:hypothetical protein
MNELVSPITSAAVGTGPDGQGVVGTLISHFESALIIERNFYGILLGVWLAFLLIGVLVVIWHSGGRERYRRLRGLRDDDSNGGSMRSGSTHPIYNQYADEKEAQFRGLSPSPSVPRIIEPANNKSTTTFFDTSDLSNSTPRPFVPRKSTFGATLSTLAAPGQAFLRMTNRSTSSLNEDTYRGLVRPGTSSERYNSGYDQDHREEIVETPQPFWISKFSRVMEGAKSIIPIRGQRHGAALQRGGSTRSDRSFGGSATLPKSDWPGKQGAGEWTMVHPSSYGRSIDGYETDSRYPKVPASSSSNVVYPRPMSRAPTLQQGGRLPVVNRDPFGDEPPSMVPSKHDSIEDGRRTRSEGVWSPGESSATSFFGGEVELGSAKTGTAALAAVLANMDRGRYRDEIEGERSPFDSPFEREEPFRRVGGRI